MRLKNGLAAAAMMGLMGALLWGQADKVEPSGKAMAAAAVKFLGSLSASQTQQARFGFDDPERVNWHFIPRVRKGLPLRDIDGAALQNALGLIQTGVSTAGYDQTLNVMSLEEVLYLLEGGERAERRERRDPRKYYLSVFGEPAATGTWGWRLEGHHVSLNFTVKDGEVVSSTPEFFGANPGLIDAGKERSIRVLAPEEDLARQLLKLCSPEQQKVAWVSKTAPDEVRGAGKLQPEVTDPVGLKAADMNADQKELLGKLIGEYLKNMPADVEARRRGELNKAGHDQIYFGWWGEEDKDKRHHYVVQGPTFIIEYNNTQNNANHVHSMWRDTHGDFNIPRQ